MSTPSALAPHIHLARCHDDLVVLDTRADDYALMVDAGALVRIGVSPGQIEAEPDILQELRAAGLLTDAPSASRQPLPGLSGEIAAHPGPLSRGLLLRAAINSLVASAVFARTPFPGLISLAAERRTTTRATSDEEIARAVGAFQIVHPWIPFEGDCLQRGFRLHHHLHRSGIPARWVFGVRTWPFLAHCWVQVGDRVVGDTVERVGTFTPILAV